MKRSILKLTAILMILIAAVTSCKKYPETQCPCGKIEINKKEYIAMCVIPNVVTANSVNKLRIDNYTKKNMIFDPTASLEYFDGTTWKSITQIGIGGQAGTEIAVCVDAGKSRDFMFAFYTFIQKYNDSKTGKYRIIKPVSLKGDYYNLVAEFEVK